MGKLQAYLVAFYLWVLTKISEVAYAIAWLCALLPRTRLARDRRAITGMILALVITLVSLSILLPIGLLLNAQIASTVNTYNLGASGNATRLALQNNIWAAFNLSAIIPIVAAAGIIIAVIVGAFAIRQGRQQGG